MNRTNRLPHFRLPHFGALLGVLLSAFLVLPAAPARAEDDPFAGALFPPDLVLRHMTDLGLDADQISAIKDEVRQAQSFFLDRQVELQTEMGRLRELIEPARPDEDAVLAQLDRVLELERGIKRAQIGLLVRIKRLLRPEQQETLRTLRAGK